MKPKKPRRGKTKNQFIERLQEMLVYALGNQDDFIITYETRPDDDKRDIHVLSGKLITPCMLGTLQNRAELQESEGSKRLTIEWE